MVFNWCIILTNYWPWFRYTWTVCITCWGGYIVVGAFDIKSRCFDFSDDYVTATNSCTPWCTLKIAIVQCKALVLQSGIPLLAFKASDVRISSNQAHLHCNWKRRRYFTPLSFTTLHRKSCKSCLATKFRIRPLETHRCNRTCATKFTSLRHAVSILQPYNSIISHIQPRTAHSASHIQPRLPFAFAYHIFSKLSLSCSARKLESCN